MTTISFNLPEHLKTFLERRALEMGFAGPGPYLESLVAREEKRRRALADLEAKLIEGAEAESIEVTDDYVAQKRAELIRKYAPQAPRAAKDE